MKICSEPACPGVLRLGRPLEYGDSIERCGDCGEPLEDGPAGGDAPAVEAQEDPASWSPLVVTLGGVLLMLVGLWVTAPGVDLAELRDGELARTGRNWRSHTSCSVFAVGVAPFFSAAVLAELVAWLLPSWRARCFQGPAARRSLDVVAMLFGVLLAATQSYGVAVAQSDLDGGSRARWLVFFGGSLAALALARLVTRRGLADGLPLLFVADRILRWVIGQVELLLDRRGHDAAEVQGVPMRFAAMVAVGVLVAVVLRQRGASGVERPTAEGYRVAAEEKRVSLAELPVPASGLVPLSLVEALFRLDVVLFSLGVSGRWFRFADLLWSNSTLNALLGLALVIPLAWVFQPRAEVLLFHGRAFPRDADDMEVPASPLRRTFLLLAGIVLIREVAQARGSYMDPLGAALVAALLMDGAAELRLRQARGALVAAAQEHRPHVAAIVARKLESEGIAVAARGLHLRAMLRFFGPLAPVTLLVPAGQAARARKIARRVIEGPRPKRRARQGEQGA